ncbi:MAG: TetR/AcrR family transcriptional regulator [Sneathiellaceae bacterium]
MRSDRKTAGAKAEGKSDKTRRRILDAAALVLRHKGFAGTRLVDIAKVADMQAGSLYYYFGSREELVAEVMRTGVCSAFDAVTRRLAEMPAEASHVDRLCAAMETHLLFLVEQSDYASATIKLIGQVPKDMQQQQIATERTYGKLWKQLLRDARDAGEIRADLNLSAIRMMIMGALNWSVEWHRPENGPAEHIARDFIAMVMHGLAVRR